MPGKEDNLKSLCEYLKKSVAKENYQDAARYYLAELKDLDTYESSVSKYALILATYKEEVAKQLQSLTDEKAQKLAQEVLDDIELCAPFLSTIIKSNCLLCDCLFCKIIKKTSNKSENC